MNDLAEEGFHEIQLSGKQLVFLFIATTTVLVGIFLLGVQVGRSVKSDRLTQNLPRAGRRLSGPGQGRTGGTPSRLGRAVQDLRPVPLACWISSSRSSPAPFLR